MSQYQSPFNPQHCNIPVLPKRPEWDIRGARNTPDISALEAGTSLDVKWNRWVDRVGVILRIMFKESEKLDLTDDDYMGFIRMFSELPEPPRTEPGETYENKPEHNGWEFTRVPVFEQYLGWGSYGDAMVEVHDKFARALSRHKVRGIGDLGLSDMSLSGAPSTGTYLRDILGSMLGPRQSFNTASGKHGGESASLSKNNKLEQSVRNFEQELQRKREDQKSGSARLTDKDGNVQDFGIQTKYSRLNTSGQTVQDLNIQDLSIEDREMEDCGEL